MNTLSIGSTLQDGKYSIVKILGQGGFGITYLVKHNYLNVYFAIKEFFPQDYCERDSDTSQISITTTSQTHLVEQLRARFLSEARNIATLNHPRIIRINDVFEENGTAYFVMNYVEGEPLSELVKHRGPLPEPQAKSLILKVAEALDFVHQQKMTHFDVKPSNIMIRKNDGSPVLIDFGLSKQYNENGDERSRLLDGLISRGYSPLEQYLKRGITSFSPKSDIYSLGATLYFLLTARVPPEAPVLAENPIEIPGNISTQVSDTIKWAMKTGLEDRCPDVPTFIKSLEETRVERATEIYTSQDTYFDTYAHTPPQPDTNRRVEYRMISKEKKGVSTWLLIILASLTSALLVVVILKFWLNSSETKGSQSDNEKLIELEEHSQWSVPSAAKNLKGEIGGRNIDMWLDFSYQGNGASDVQGQYRFSDNKQEVYFIDGIQESSGLIRVDVKDNYGQVIERIRAYLNDGKFEGQRYSVVDKSKPIVNINAYLISSN